MSRLNRTGCALGKWGRGVSGILFGYYSSQGKPERTNRVSRMLHNAGNLSIQLFVLIAGIFFVTSVQAQSLNSEGPKTLGEGFEVMMLQNMYAQMRATNDAFSGGEGDYFAPSPAEKIYREMLDQTIVSKTAKHGPLGVGILVDRYLEGKGGIRRQPQVKSEIAGQEGVKNGIK
jgi:hypothetical protein